MGTITDKLNKLAETKSAIKTAIVNKGVAVSDSDTFASYADKIASISGSGGSGDLDFSKIGYDSAPAVITEGIAAGEALYNRFNPNASNWNTALGVDSYTNVTNQVFFPKLVVPEDSNLYNSNTPFPKLSNSNLMTFPEIKLGKLVIKQGMFSECPKLIYVHLNADEYVFYDSEYQNMTFQGSNVNEIVIKNTVNIEDINCSHMFENCRNLKHLDVTFSGKPSNIEYMFSNLGNSNSPLDTIPSIDWSNITSNSYFIYSAHFNTLKEQNTINITNFDSFGSNSHGIRIEGLYFDSNSDTVYYYYITQGCYYVLLKNIGKVDSAHNYNLSWGTWGTETSDPLTKGALQSVRDSLITYSFDRAGAGYTNNCTITLSSKTKALLTQDEIAQITAKGYTIA